MVSRYFLLFFSFLALAACANSPSDKTNERPISRPYLPVEVNILSDVRGILPEYPVSGDSERYRAYVQASNNDRYRIRVSNNTDGRIGVVIAVDGRNIISGQKSYLQNNERMYILNPHSSGDYEGWRTAANKVNRFYFTAPENSYAAAWGDTSAMGVIAVAVYPEVQRPPVVMPMPEMSGKASVPGAARSENRAKMQSDSAGTGYGEKQYSPTTLVNFEPQAETIEKVFLKYEWRETLCKKGIKAACQMPPPPGQNRFWPDDDLGYAPPPPGRYYR